jgi:hypothetical protein
MKQDVLILAIIALFAYTVNQTKVLILASGKLLN